MSKKPKPKSFSEIVATFVDDVMPIYTFGMVIGCVYLLQNIMEKQRLIINAEGQIVRTQREILLALYQIDKKLNEGSENG